MSSLSKLNPKGLSDATRIGSQLITSLGPHNGEACVDEILAVDIDGRQGVVRRRVTIQRESDYQEAQQHRDDRDFWHKHCDLMTARYQRLYSNIPEIIRQWFIVGFVAGLLCPYFLRCLFWMLFR